ncbi:MAG: hypothetical protein Kow0069_21400 [Promethearchaeota archaeon]
MSPPTPSPAQAAELQSKVETAQSAEFRRTIEKVKGLLEKEFRRILADEYGIQGHEDVPVPLEQVVRYQVLATAEEKDAFRKRREKVRQAVQLEADQVGSWEEGFYWYVDHQVYTFFNRVFAVRVMEELGLLSESTLVPAPDLGNRSARMARIVDAHPGASREEAHVLTLRDAFEEIGREVSVLFEDEDPEATLWPRGLVIEKVLTCLAEIDPKTFSAPDAVGWFYHYYVVNYRKSHKTMSGHGGKNPRNTYLLSILNTVYTPRWMVEFLVVNSLGRWWQDAYPDSRLFTGHPLFIQNQRLFPHHPADQRKLEEIRVLDPACGSGNFLVYAFECLFQMYREAHPSWPVGEVISQILSRNLFGIDINRRPAQLAALALYLHAKRLLKANASPEEANKFRMPAVNIFCCDIRLPEDDSRTLFFQQIRNPHLAKIVKDILDQFEHADEIGSLMNLNELHRQFHSLKKQRTLYDYLKKPLSSPAHLVEYVDQVVPRDLHHVGVQVFGRQARRAISLAQALMDEYDFIFTNPPFGLLVKRTQARIKESYPHSYMDLVAAFVDQALRLLRENGCAALVTDHSFMHLPKFEKFRKNVLLTNAFIQTLFLAGEGALPDAANKPVLFVLRKTQYTNESPSLFRYLLERFFRSTDFIKSDIHAINSWDGRGPLPPRWSRLPQALFLDLPGAVIAPIITEDVAPLVEFFRKYPPLDPRTMRGVRRAHPEWLHVGRCFKGISTGAYAAFLRYWFEVPPSTIRLAEHVSDLSEVPSRPERPWVPCSKGGGDKRYYLANGYVAWWSAEAIGQMKKGEARLQNIPLLGRSHIHWSRVGKRRGRFCISQKGLLATSAAFCLLISNDDERDLQHSLLGFLNSLPCFFFGNFLTKDRDWNVGIVGRFPIPLEFLRERSELGDLAKESHDLRRDWDTGYPMSPLFAETLVDKVLVPNPTVERRGKPKTGHPFTADYKPCQSPTARAIDAITVPPQTATFKDLLDAVEKRLGVLTRRLDEIDREVDDVCFRLVPPETRLAVESAYEGTIGPLEYPVERNTWLRDFLMANLVALVRAAPRGVITLYPHPRSAEGLYNQFVALLEEKFQRDAAGVQPLLRELETLLKKPVERWIADDFFAYHCQRFGGRPVVWQFTSRLKPTMAAALDVFVDYHQVTADTLPNLRVDCVEPVLEYYQQQQAAGLLPADKAHFPEELTQFAAALRELAEEGYDELPTMNALTGKRVARRGMGDDKAFWWVAENALEVVRGGYHPDPMKGVLVNLLPLCLEVPGESRWKAICPQGTAKRILKKIDTLDQLRQEKKTTEGKRRERRE